jgi:gliding motility-associated-like protein
LLLTLFLLSTTSVLFGQVRPTREYRSGMVNFTTGVGGVRATTGTSRSAGTPGAIVLGSGRNGATPGQPDPTIPLPYPAVSNAQAGAKHRTVLSGTITLTIDEVDSYCGSYNGSVLVHASGGTPPYTYSFDGGLYQSSALYVTDGPFTHSVNVKDAAGQVVSQTVFVGNSGSNPSVFAASYIQPTGCSNSDASITLRGSGGTMPYEYSMDLKNWQTSPTFSGLSYGWYYFWAKDARGCVSNGLWWPWDGCVSGGGSWAGYSCNNSGSLSFTASDNGNFTGPFQYSLDGTNWQNTGVFNNLPSGSITLQVKDHAGAIGFFRFVILDGCILTLQLTVTDATCGNNNGQIVATATNGIGPYEYSIDGLNFQSSPTFTGLAPGNYTVWLHDLTGTLVSATALVQDGCPTVTAVATDAFCGNNDGSITATGHGGRTPYRFSLDGTNFQSSPTFSPLAPGTYTIWMKDADNFPATTTATVGNNCLQVTATPTNTSCGRANGSIHASATGGTPPYTYSIGGAYQSSPDFAGLSAQGYTLSVKDQSATVRSIPVTLTDVAGPGLTVVPHPVDCNGQGGTLTLQGSGGTGSLSYSLDGSSYGPGAVFSGAAGNYTAYVMDGNGCVTTQPATIGVACLRLALAGRDASCGADDGTIAVTPSGGRPGYEYSIDNGANWQTGGFSGLAPGSYTIQGRDADGLTSSASVQLARVCITGTLTPLDASCGENNGQIAVQVSGGTAPYSYSLDAGAHSQTDPLLGSLAPGSYTVQMSDAKGFIGSATASIAAIPLPSLGVQTSAATCRNNDGVIAISVTGGTTPYQYSLDAATAVGSGRFEGVASGEYPVRVVDARGCPVAGTATVDLINNLTVTISTPAPICEGKKVVLAAVSNAESFSWTPGDGLDKSNVLTPVAGPSATTPYHLTASTGVCQVAADVTVSVYPAPVADAGKDDTVCYGKSTQLDGSGGGTYSWKPSTYLSDATAGDATVVHPLQTTTYYLSVTDDKGCTSLRSDAVTITVTPPPAVWIGNDTSILAGQPVPMEVADVNNSGFTDFSWTPVTGLDRPSVRNPVATPEQSVTYTVLASTPAGCEGQASRAIKVYSVAGIFVPNAFSPNGDGHNDLLRARPVGIREFKYFAVFNRWGQRVFYTADPAVGWDGGTAGQTALAGTYVWMAAGVDYRGVLIERKGTVIVVR